MQDSVAATGEHNPQRLKPVYVFEAPVRLWHWVNALSIAVLAVTGYLISEPLPSSIGEPSDRFVMGYIRYIHFVAAYVFAIGFAVRIYWAFVGNTYARELFILPIWKPSWWKQIWHEVKFYNFLTDELHKEIGHNPLAQAAMFVFTVIVGLFMILTGFALYSQGLGQGSWADQMFGWVIPVIGGSKEVQFWHNIGMWLMLVFIVIHIYMAIRADIISRQSSISTIFGGWRYYRDDKP